MHGAFERFWPRFFGAEAASLTITTRRVGTACCCPPGSSGGAPRVLTVRLDGSTGYGLISMPVRKSSLPLDLPGWPFALRPWSG
jgi:hypothetical protein